MRAACLYLAQKLRLRCGLLIDVTSFDDLNVQFFRKLYNSICLPFIVDPDPLPDIKQGYGIDFVDKMMQIISCDFLNFDLSRHFSAEAICVQNPEAIHYFLLIFDNLRSCFFGDDVKKVESSLPVKNRPVPGERPRFGTTEPQHWRPILRNFGQKSVLFSPKTALHKKPKKMGLSQEKLTKIGENLANFRNLDILSKLTDISQSDLQTIGFSDQLHKARTTKLLNLLKHEHSCTEQSIKNRIAKVILRRSIDNSLYKASRSKNQDLMLRRAKLTYDNLLKNQKRWKVEESKAQSDQTVLKHGFFDCGTDLHEDDLLELNESLKQAKADAEAQHFLRNLAREKAAKVFDEADSVENSAKDRVDQFKEI